MRDGPVRFVIKRLALINFNVATRLRRTVMPPRHHLGGGCQRCAACCESPAIAAPAWLASSAPVRWVFLAWHRWVNGFEPVEFCKRVDRDPRHAIVDGHPELFD